MTPLVQTLKGAFLLVPYVDFPAQFEAQREEILKAVEGVLTSGDYILGHEVEELEKEFAALCGVQHAIGVANGTDALILSLRALEIGPGDEVITAPNSWISSASCIALVGARPVFVDVQEDFTIDPEKIERAVTAKTKAILPVHLTGRVADMGRIADIAKRRHLFVVEDAAQAAGAHRQGKTAGSFGTVGCFSFHPLKNLSGMGDGGMITTNREDLAEKLRLLRNHGLRSRGEAVLWGFNSRLDTLQAAVLRLRLRHLSRVIETRRRHAQWYQEELSDTVSCPVDRSDEYSTYHLFMIQCDRRDALSNFLSGRGIETKVHYPTPLHLQPVGRSLGYQEGDFPVVEGQAKRILSLPVHQELSQEQLEAVVQAILEFYR